VVENCPDTLLPSGSIHAYDNAIWSPNNKMVTASLQGRVADESGISSAYILVGGDNEITLTDLDENGNFFVDIEMEATKGAEYSIELYAADNYPEELGGPNSGLIDSTYIRVPHDMGGGKSNPN